MLDTGASQAGMSHGLLYVVSGYTLRIMATNRAFTYDPTTLYEFTSYDVEYRRDEGSVWPATVFQPKGKGPCPALLDVHGGAWNRGSLASNAPIDTRLAECGLVVVAIDFRLASGHTYPEQVANVNFAIHWLKAHAADFNTISERLGGIGSSIGGHTIMLSAMRPMVHATPRSSCPKRRTPTVPCQHCHDNLSGSTGWILV